MVWRELTQPGGRVDTEGVPAAEPITVGVAGAGSIGVAWAVVFARAGYDVRLFEPDSSRRSRVPAELAGKLTALASEGLLARDADAIAARVRVHEDLADAAAGVSYMQECAPESLALKRDLFARLDPLVPAGAVLASSSSALTCSAIAAGLAGAGRCLVAHPGNPPYLLPVVELVPGPQTQPAALDAADELLRRAGMLPIRLRKEIEGFVFNRLQGAVLREAYRLVRDGVVEPEDLDLLMRAGLGRRWSVLGPFETVELNTRGGIDAHAAIMGPAYARMVAPGEEQPVWERGLVERVSRAVRSRFPRTRWEEHVAWRDRALMVLERCRREHPALAGPQGGAAPPPDSAVPRRGSSGSPGP